MKSNDLQIVTASFKDMEHLKKKGFALVSVEGKSLAPQQEGLEMLKGFSTYRMRFHLMAKDFAACYYLYLSKLQKKGFEKIAEQLEVFSHIYSTGRIALLGSGKRTEFCFTHIVADFLRANGVAVTEWQDEIDWEAQKALWHYDPYRKAGHDNLTDNEVGAILEECKYIFASTMPHNPHEYTLRKDFGNDRLFLSVVKHLRNFGKFEEFGGMLFRCFYWKGFKFFTHPADLTNESCDLINKVKVN